MFKSVKIPEERLAVLIGERGATKRLIQKKTKTKITVGEEIIIEGDALDVLTAESIVKAIGRGFSPPSALLLLDEENCFDLVQLPDNKKTRKRICARLIGTKGKARRNLEHLTKTRISVYGKTVGIIGSYDDTEKAKTAIENLIGGFSHRSVYELLEKK